MKEKTFQSEWGHSIRVAFPEAFYTKIPDAPYSPNIIKRPIEKPFDCFCVKDNIFYAFELKMHSKDTAFPFSNVKPHQKEALLKITDNGFPAYILINIRTKVSDKIKAQFSLDKCTIIYVYCISISDYIEMEAESSRKSIPFQFFIDEMNGERSIGRIRLPDNTLGWDVGKILWKSRALEKL